MAQSAQMSPAELEPFCNIKIDSALKSPCCEVSLVAPGALQHSPHITCHHSMFNIVRELSYEERGHFTMLSP